MDEILAPIISKPIKDNERILDTETLEIESDKNNKIEIIIDEIKINKYFLINIF